jgi:hypothetical protein
MLLILFLQKATFEFIKGLLRSHVSGWPAAGRERIVIQIKLRF